MHKTYVHTISITFLFSNYLELLTKRSSNRKPEHFLDRVNWVGNIFLLIISRITRNLKIYANSFIKKHGITDEERSSRLFTT